MLFNEKYPTAKEGEVVEHGDYVLNHDADNCYVCGRLTHFFERNAGTYICSEECDEELYYMFFMNAIEK